MRRLVKGDKVEVLKTFYEYSWHPAKIVEGNGDVSTVLYDRPVNGVMVEVVLTKDIRPRPPVVDFSNWSRRDLVHVLDNFAWKLATVLQVLEKKQYLVRVVGSMKDLYVNAAWIRVRHCWQESQWIIVGKGPSMSDVVKQPVTCRNMVSDLKIQHRSSSSRDAWRSAREMSQTRTIKRKAPSTLGQPEERKRLANRTTERSSPYTRNQIEACTGTGMRSRLTEELQDISRSRPTITNATPEETQKKDNDSCLSSVGSCSINDNSSSHLYPTKCAGHRCDEDVSDAESCSGPASKPGSKTRIIILRKGQKTAEFERPVQRCKLVLRFRQQNSLSRLPLPTPDDSKRW